MSLIVDYQEEIIVLFLKFLIPGMFRSHEFNDKLKGLQP